jgi:hypothetical protein
MRSAISLLRSKLTPIMIQIFYRLCYGGELFDKISEEQFFSEVDAAHIVK